MSPAESILPRFNPNDFVWNLLGTKQAIAIFDEPGCHVEVTFTEVGNEWRVTYTALESIDMAIKAFSGVFQAVKEFLEVRQPKKLVIASKDEALANIYRLHLNSQDADLCQMGYELVLVYAGWGDREPRKFVIQKTTPSAWNAN